jgi:hypothetical protein
LEWSSRHYHDWRVSTGSNTSLTSQLSDYHSKWKASWIPWGEDWDILRFVERQYCWDVSRWLLVACFQLGALPEWNTKVPRKGNMALLGTYWKQLLWIYETWVAIHPRYTEKL